MHELYMCITSIAHIKKAMIGVISFSSNSSVCLMCVLCY